MRDVPYSDKTALRQLGIATGHVHSEMATQTCPVSTAADRQDAQRWSDPGS